MHAYGNPNEGNHKAAGYGLVRFRKPSREIVMECWPRFVDVTRADARQFPGWPITVAQEANYGRGALAWLPTLVIRGQTNPVVQIVDEYNQEIVYTLRINGTRFRPKVFRAGFYTVKVGEGINRQVLQHVASLRPKETQELEIDLGRSGLR